MNSVFENVYTREEHVARDMYLQQYLRNPRTKGLFAIYAAILVLVMLVFSQQNVASSIVVMLLCAAYLVFSNWHTAKKMGKKILARDKERYGESPAEITTMVTPLGITVRGKQGYDGKIGYDEIGFVLVTKRYILLYLKARSVHALPTYAFTRGEPDECVEFIKSKGVKVKMSKRAL